MSRFIAIHCSEQQARAVVVRSRTTGTAIEAVLTMPLDGANDPSQIGRRLARALAPYRKGLQQTVICVDRDRLQWQQFSLPPAPASDLPDLVRFQAERDLVLADDATGLDFLLLSGDENSPHQVLAIAIAPTELAAIRQVADAAELKIDRLVPLQAGWLAIVRRAVAMQKSTPTASAGTSLFAASQASDATIWATTGNRVVLLRTLRLPGLGNPAALSQALRGELQRTMLTLEQTPSAAPVADVWLAGDLAQTGLVEDLGQQLPQMIHTVDASPLFSSAHFSADEGDRTPAPADCILAGLVLDEAERLPPPVDLLNPRHQAVPANRGRTWALAAAAVAALLMLAGWHGYQNIAQPRQAAARAHQQLAELEQSIADYQADEQQAAAIRNWTTASVNLLEQLEQLSLDLRKKPLDEEDFAAENDVVLMELNLQGQQFQLDAIARNRNAVQPLEAQLRGDRYLVERDNPRKTGKLGKYVWPFRVIVELADEPSSSEGKPPATEGDAQP